MATARSLLAEGLVTRAVGTARKLRIEWDAYDVLTPDGIRLKVRSGAYLQGWRQSRLLTVMLGGLNPRTWSPTDDCSTASLYNADAYVFAVLTATEHDEHGPLDIAQWLFWALPAHPVAVSCAALAQRIRDVATGP